MYCAPGAAMLIVPIEEARPGMKLAADVLHPAQLDQVLLRRGFVLEPGVLDRLRDLGVLAIYVDYPGLAELDRHLVPALSPEKLRIYGQVKATIAAVQKTAQPSVGFADYYCAVREFVITLFRQGEHPLYLEQIAVRLGDDAVAHATAVAHLSLVLGIKLQGYLMDQRRRLPAAHAAEVVNLGIAGMLHDIGKCKLPAAAADFTTPCPPADPKLRDLWETHPRVGYEMVRGGIEASAAVAVLQHHERFDGQGFPPILRRGKHVVPAAHAIHVFARVLHVADLFDRLTHPAAPQGENRRAGRPAYAVLRQMADAYAEGMDPVVFGALLKAVPPFPLGGRVKLTDGTEAVVTAAGVKDAYRPVVRRFQAGTTAADWTNLEDKAVDLSQDGMPAVVVG
jgi:HD-GYP domain-containing protein (c-di-GMP phosphodiesterase class II)